MHGEKDKLDKDLKEKILPSYILYCLKYLQISFVYIFSEVI